MYIYDIKIIHSLNILVDLSVCQIRASLHANMFGGILDKKKQTASPTTRAFKSCKMNRPGGGLKVSQGVIVH